MSPSGSNSAGFKRLLDQSFERDSWRIISDDDDGEDARLEIALPDLRLRFIAERGVAFWIDVANAEGRSRFFSLRKMLLLASGSAIERSRVLASRDIAGLSAPLTDLLSSREKVVDLLAADRLAETEKAIDAIDLKTLHPVIARALKR